MRKTVRRWWWVWDFEKEEAWLNGMAESGWVLDSVGFCRYDFVSCEPGEYIVRLELRENDPSYIVFMNDTGAEFVGRCFQWIYFRRKSELGAFDIFSDIDSRIGHLQKIEKTLKLIGCANLLVGTANILNGMTVAVINLLCATLLMYGLGRIQGKREMMEKERMLHE